MCIRDRDFGFERWKVIHVSAGFVLQMGECVGPGARAYILFRGGLDVPKYLGSASTFTLGKFGGHAGRALRTGDVLHICGVGARACPKNPEGVGASTYPTSWEIGAVYGPHGAPDFFTRADIETFFSADWKVHYNSCLLYTSRCV